MLGVDRRFFALVFASVLLSALTVVLGAMPLRQLRLHYGRLNYFFAMLAATALAGAFGLPPLALILFSLTILVGLFVEVEEQGFSYFASAVLSVLATIGVSALCVSFWMKTMGVNLVVFLREQVGLFVERMMQMNPALTLETDKILVQVPSVVVIVLALSLALSIIFEKWLCQALKFSTEKSVDRHLSAFTVPDFFVWILMASLLGSFLQMDMPGVQALALNFLNVLVVLYFFQGLAVVAHVFNVYQVGPIWRGAWYVLLVVQLFLFVSILGFVDFWIDFRRRISRKTAESKRVFK